MIQARKHGFKLRDHTRTWILLCSLLLGSWILLHLTQLPAWLQPGGYDRALQRPMQLLLDEASPAGICSNGTCFWRPKSSNADEEDDIPVEQQPDGAPRLPGGKKSCATVEDMGVSSTPRGVSRARDLRLRDMIREYIFEHGAQRVRELPGEEFCRRGFVYGKSDENGFGNEMYKLLTAAGLALMLNRSLIIGDDSSKAQVSFGDYMSFSNETFTMKEVKHLWTKNKCKRALSMRVDSLQKLSGSYSTCGDWRNWSNPIIWFHGAQDVVALQLFLKNVHPGMRQAAERILGDSFTPSTRGNLFGELFRAFISPKPVLQNAVEWSLGGGRNPDISLHLRMLNSRSRPTIEAACSCVRKMLSMLEIEAPRIIVVTDTPAVLSLVEKKLESFAEVIYFDHQLYLNSSADVSHVMNQTLFQPPRKRVQDWGPLPRWVALVDFFLASRASHGVVSAGAKRVGTTYAQLVASVAAANSLDDSRGLKDEFVFFSSFRSLMLVKGLVQRGWGHAWRTFSGKLSCFNQANQCALTPLLAPAWWDGPLQLPTSREAQILRSLGITFNSSGNLAENDLHKFCRTRKPPKIIVLKLG